jgi:hypothetical protein
MRSLLLLLLLVLLLLVPLCAPDQHLPTLLQTQLPLLQQQHQPQTMSQTLHGAVDRTLLSTVLPMHAAGQGSCCPNHS